MITTTIYPPEIRYKFNPLLLLSTLERMGWIYKNVILPMSDKKIRTIDVGKRKKFDLLKQRFEELYGRKTAEEANYKAKIKKETKKRPNSESGKTSRFTRFVPK